MPLDKIGEPSPRQEKILAELAGSLRNCPDFISLETYRDLFDKLGVKSGDKILDVGAGFVPLQEQATQYVKAMEGRGVILIPFDPNQLRAKSWLLLEPEQPDDVATAPIKGDVLEMPFKDNSFEGIISINFLNAIGTKEAVFLILEKLYKVLKSGGFVIISTFGYFEKQMRDGRKLYNNNFKSEHLFGANFIKEQGLEAGFESVEDVPLDDQLISTEVDFVSKKARKKSDDFVAIKMINPVGLLFRKF